MRRHFAAAILAVSLCAATTPLVAQRSNVSALDSARASAPTKEKDPTTASLLGFVPGVGHLYAEDINRGWLVMAVYWTGVAITHNGRTDNIGKVGGVMLLGGLVFSVVDAANAARRYNTRMAKLRAAAREDSVTGARLRPTAAHGASAPTSRA